MAQPPVGVDKYVDPAQSTPDGALCATGGFYPPLQPVWEADTVYRTTLSRNRAGRLLANPLVGVVPYFLTAFANPSVWVMFISASTHITSTPNSFASACPRSKGSRNSAVDRASATPESPARMETLRQ